MTVRCHACGQTWPRDPALEVPCQTCNAAVGRRCKRPSGHPCGLHASRDLAAMDAGLLAPCTATNPPPTGEQYALAV